MEYVLEFYSPFRSGNYCELRIRNLYFFDNNNSCEKNFRFYVWILNDARMSGDVVKVVLLLKLDYLLEKYVSCLNSEYSHTSSIVFE